MCIRDSYLLLALIIPSDNPAVSSSQEVKDFARDLGTKVHEVAGEFKSPKPDQSSATGSGRRFFGPVSYTHLTLPTIYSV